MFFYKLLIFSFFILFSSFSYAGKLNSIQDYQKLVQAAGTTCKQEKHFKGQKDILQINCTNNSETKKKILVSMGGQKLFLSKNGRYLLGLSNIGYIEQAYWIVDLFSDGKVLKVVAHGDKNNSINYCSTSISRIRKWADLQDPKVQFVITETGLKSVKVNSCDSNIIEIFKTSS